MAKRRVKVDGKTIAILAQAKPKDNSRIKERKCLKCRKMFISNDWIWRTCDKCRAINKYICETHRWADRG